MKMVPFTVEDHVPDELKFEQGYVNDALFDLRGEVRVHRRRRFSYSVDVFRVRGLRARPNVREIIERRFSYLEVFAVQGISPHRAPRSVPNLELSGPGGTGSETGQFETFGQTKWQQESSRSPHRIGYR